MRLFLPLIRYLSFLFLKLFIFPFFFILIRSVFSLTREWKLKRTSIMLGITRAILLFATAQSFSHVTTRTIADSPHFGSVERKADILTELWFVNRLCYNRRFPALRLSCAHGRYINRVVNRHCCEYNRRCNVIHGLKMFHCGRRLFWAAWTWVGWIVCQSVGSLVGRSLSMCIFGVDSPCPNAW